MATLTIDWLASFASKYKVHATADADFVLQSKATWANEYVIERTDSGKYLVELNTHRFHKLSQTLYLNLLDLLSDDAVALN